MRAVRDFLQEALRIRPDELRRTAIAFVYLFTTIGAFITARITKASLFLEIPDYKKQLPLTYIGTALVVTLVMSRYAKVERRLRRDLTNVISLGVIIVVTLGFRLLLGWDRGSGWVLENPKHEVYWAFLLWTEVMGAMVIVQFWSLIPEVFTSRQAKRLFAVIGGGGVLANIAFGKLNGAMVASIGTENLLFVIAGCLTASAGMVYLLGVDARTELTVARERAPVRKSPSAIQRGGFGEAFATRHVQLIAVVIVLTYFVSAIVDLQFNVIVGDSIPGKDARSAYFADFFAYTGIIAAVIQFTMTARILERFGVLVALFLLPLCMLGGTAALASGFLPLLWAGTLTKGSENVLRYTVNDSTVNLLYLPVPSHVRGRAKAIIDGMLKAVSMGMAGLIAALLGGTLDHYLGISVGLHFDVEDFAWLVAVALVAWAVCLVFVRREYLRSLVDTLQRRRLNFDEVGFEITDEATIRTLSSALASDNVGHVLHALELMPQIARKAREPLHDALVGLMMHEAEEVRVAALEYLHDTQEHHRDEVGELLDDGSRDVRAAAVLAYCSGKRETGIARVHAMLSDPDPKVQAATVAGLIRYGGLDGVLACADLLKNWLSGDDVSARRHAAWVLGEVGVQNFFQPLIPLLADDSEVVRLEAVRAAGRLRNPQLIGPLVEQLSRPRVCGAAVQALVNYGPDVEGVIAGVLQDAERSPGTRVHACKILARLGDAHGVRILSDHLVDDDAHIRSAVVHALDSIYQRLPGIRPDRAAIGRAVHREAERWFSVLALTVDLELGAADLLLSDALGHRSAMAQSLILDLLGLVYPRETLDLVARNVQSKQATLQANALEVLDNLLDKNDKDLVVPIFDDATAERKLQAAGEVFDLRRSGRETRLEELLTGDDPWLRSCAAMEVGRSGVRALQGRVEELLTSTNAVNRETAIVALRRLLEPAELEARVVHLAGDSVAHVRRYASFALEDGTR